MSRIRDVKEKLQNCISLAMEYEEHLVEAKANLLIKGKMLEEALKEQAAWPIFYDEKRAELETVCKYVWSRVEAERSKLIKTFKEGYSRELTDRMIDKYVDNQDEYLKTHELYLEVKEVYEKYVAVVEAFKTRGFALRDITLSRVHNMQNATL